MKCLQCRVKWSSLCHTGSQTRGARVPPGIQCLSEDLALMRCMQRCCQEGPKLPAFWGADTLQGTELSPPPPHCSPLQTPHCCWMAHRGVGNAEHQGETQAAKWKMLPCNAGADHAGPPRATQIQNRHHTEQLETARTACTAPAMPKAAPQDPHSDAKPPPRAALTAAGSQGSSSFDHSRSKGGAETSLNALKRSLIGTSIL